MDAIEEREGLLPLYLGRSSFQAFLLIGCRLWLPILGSLALVTLVEAAGTGDMIHLYELALLSSPFLLLSLWWVPRNWYVALRERPSDLVLGRVGLRIAGGQLDGFSEDWSDVETTDVLSRPQFFEGDEAKAAPPKRGNWDGAEPLWRWVLRLRDGSRHILQTGESRREKGFLRISCEIARRYFTLHAGPSAEGRSAEGVARCESCGGELPVGEGEAVSCEFCGALVRRPSAAVASSLRPSMDGHVQGFDARRLALLASLPDARRRTRVVLIAAGVAILGGLCLAIPAVLDAKAGRFFEVLFLFLAYLGIVPALYFTVAGQIPTPQSVSLLLQTGYCIPSHSESSASGATTVADLQSLLRRERWRRCLYTSAGLSFMVLVVYLLGRGLAFH